MKIDVDILDRSMLLNSQIYTQLKDDATLVRCSTISQAQESIRKTVTDSIQSFLKNYKKLDTTIITSDDNLEKMSLTFYDNFIKEVNSKACKNDFLNIGLAKSILNESFVNFKNEINDVFGTPKVKNEKVYDSLLANLGSEIEQNFSQGIYGTNISFDPLASFVVSVPEQFWSKTKPEFDFINNGEITMDDKFKDRPARINNTKVSTFFGNADIAIKMDAPGYFVVKGVRLDADEAFKASFKVLNQGIKYLAYSTGIPIPNPGTAAENTTDYVAKIPELEQNDSLHFNLKNTQLQFDNEVRDLMLIILNNKELLQTPKKGAAEAEKYKSAINQIKTGYNFFNNTQN